MRTRVQVVIVTVLIHSEPIANLQVARTYPLPTTTRKREVFHMVSLKPVIDGEIELLQLKLGKLDHRGNMLREELQGVDASRHQTALLIARQQNPRAPISRILSACF